MTNESKKSDFTSRLKCAIGKSGDNNKDFARKCGITEKQIYVYLKGSSEPGTKFYRNMMEQYPQINLNWLISGHGDPTIKIKEENNIVPMDPAVGLVVEVENELGVKLNVNQRHAVVTVLRRELDRRLGEQKADITNLISSFTKKDLE